MSAFKSFIESQFPVSKLSKESYKERKANNTQTLTGLGKWWGRKPLILVRATILGLLMPSSHDHLKDREIFLKILTMDNEGLRLRKNKRIPIAKLAEISSPKELKLFFSQTPAGKWSFIGSRIDRENYENLIFDRLGYDEKLEYCLRPEQLEGPSPQAWAEINKHLGTSVLNFTGLIQELGIRQFGHVPKVGDGFCGGGSFPFEAARMGLNVFASDLNPVATLLTWASLNIIGGGSDVHKKVREAQEKALRLADQQITEWGIEHNEKGWRADAYLYCLEAKSPATGYWVPLAPSWRISEKFNVCAVLEPDHAKKRYNINIITKATIEQMAQAQKGTIADSDLLCPETGQHFSISSIRGDRRIEAETIYGLRQWENEDLVPRPEDTFQERLYCIRYIETYYEQFINGVITELTKEKAESLSDFQELLDSGLLKQKSRRHFIAPDVKDLEREKIVLAFLNEKFLNWQELGFLPSLKIINGYNTDQPIRERGWTYWHHLYHPRQLLIAGLLNKLILENYNSKEIIVGGLLGLGKLANWNSRLCRWLSDAANEKGSDVFTNQALNTFYNYSVRPIAKLDTVWNYNISSEDTFKSESTIIPSDARSINEFCDIWITDPPYADAVNYHELGDFFLAWYEKHLPNVFPEWYTESKSALAVKGTGTKFNLSMVDCYSNFTYLMPANGAQVVTFTHQDSAVWADLALILWASGLQVTSAWTIQTETDAGGIKKGNYVQGTVCMVLRKQSSNEVGFLADIQTDVEFEVRDELKRMTELEDKEDPNFSDTDYQLAAYVAALRVITGYKLIQDIDVRYELMRTRQPGEVSEIQKIIDSAVIVACEYLVPAGFDPAIWRQLSGEERFYIKSLEIQSHGEYRTGVFQELARGFGLRDYRSFLLSGRANEARMMSAIEFGTKQLGDDGFGKSLVRMVLFAIRETHKSESPRDGRQWLINELPDYWGNRQRIIKILGYFRITCSHLEYWKEDVFAVELLAGYLQNDMAGA
jgi:adenine-specific DNA methylase